LVDIVTKHGGKIMVQKGRDPNTGLLDLMVYYEVPLENKEEVKRNFNNLVRNHIVVQTNESSLFGD
jgi:hypothetical protein